MRERNEADGAPDETALLARLGGNRRLLLELVAMFREDAPQCLAAVREAVARGDAGQVKFRAHQFCSSIGAFGRSPALEAARALEALAEAGDLTGARDSYARLERAVRQLDDVLPRGSSLAPAPPQRQGEPRRAQS